LTSSQQPDNAASGAQFVRMQILKRCHEDDNNDAPQPHKTRRTDWLQQQILQNNAMFQDHAPLNKHITSHSGNTPTQLYTAPLPPTSANQPTRFENKSMRTISDRLRNVTKTCQTEHIESTQVSQRNIQQQRTPTQPTALPTDMPTQDIHNFLQLQQAEFNARK
jgi:hypothetical protein